MFSAKTRHIGALRVFPRKTQIKAAKAPAHNSFNPIQWQNKNKKKTQTTKDFVQIAEIRDTVLVLKDGSLRSVVEIGSINFELKSADEQIAIIQGFQNFINSIDFPLQIVVNSRKLDIDPYLNPLKD